MKKCFVSIVTALMMFISFTAISYGETGESNNSGTLVPKAIAVVTVDNPECILYDQIGKNLNVTVSIDNGETVIADIPVVKVEEGDDEDEMELWLGQDISKPFTDDIIAKLTEIQKDIESDIGIDISLDDMTEEEFEKLMEYMDDAEKILEKIFSSYTVTLTGLPADSETHKFEIEAQTLYLSNSMANKLIAFVKEAIGELFELTQDEMNSITKFSDLVTVLEKELKESGLLGENNDIVDVLYDGKATDAEREEFQQTLQKLDDMVAFVKTEEYKGTVITNVTVTCGCPKSIYYEVIHQYFKVKGNEVSLVGTEMYGPNAGEYKGMTGETVSAKDFIHCDYSGETYKYVGSYDSYVVLLDQEEIDDFYFDDGYWNEAKLDSFVLSDDESVDVPDGLVLRYEFVEEDTAAAADAVHTGDDMEILPFVILLAGSVIAMSAVIFARRKKI